MLRKFPRISFWGEHNRMLNVYIPRSVVFIPLFFFPLSPDLISSPSWWLALWELWGRGYIHRHFQYHSCGTRDVRCLQVAAASHLHCCSCIQLWEAAQGCYAQGGIFVCKTTTENKGKCKTNWKKRERFLLKLISSEFISFSFNLVEKHPLGLHQKINLSVSSSKWSFK